MPARVRRPGRAEPRAPIAAGKKNAGLTLIELSVVMTIVTILFAVGVPSFTSTFRNSRLTTQINDFAGALNIARSEAVKRGAPVTVCKSLDGATCGGSAVKWENGWIVFADPNGNAVVDSGEAVLRVSSGLVKSYSLRSPEASLANHIRFGSTGLSHAVGRFVLCFNNQIKPSRAVFLSLTGRIQIAPDKNGDGVPEDPSGHNIASCG